MGEHLRQGIESLPVELITVEGYSDLTSEFYGGNREGRKALLSKHYLKVFDKLREDHPLAIMVDSRFEISGGGVVKVRVSARVPKNGLSDDDIVTFHTWNILVKAQAIKSDSMRPKKE